MKNFKKWVSAAVLTLLLHQAAAQETTLTTYTFRFMPDKDMFYVPWNGNAEELQRLLTCVKENKESILDGTIPIQVEGYSTAQATTDKNLDMARIRSNRVKTEIIR